MTIKDQDVTKWVDDIESEVDRIAGVVYHECVGQLKDPSRVSLMDIMEFKSKITGIISYLTEVLSEMATPMKGEDRPYMVEEVNRSLLFIQEELDRAKINNNNKLN